MRTECPMHPSSEFRECHHIGNNYVEVHWDEGFKDWVVRCATVGKRGSISAFASKELDYMIERLRENPPSTEGEA